MPLPIQSFGDIVKNQGAAISASSSQLVDFTEGSILRALVESNAGNSIWLQSLISALLAIARLQTSSGNDVDTFIQQFGFNRPAGSAASGTVTFSRAIVSSVSYIPASTTVVQTSINQVQFTTTVDTANPNYDPATNSYIMGINVTSIDVPVTCNTAGSIGNVAASAIDTIVSSPVNVNSVTNASPFINGANIADDPTTKVDFVLYLAGLSKATLAAVESVVAVYAGVTRYVIVENKNESGATQLGYFYVIIDNGSGTISNDIVTGVSAAVGAVRGLAIQWNVDGATPHVCSALTATLTVPTGTTIAQQQAITDTIKANIAAFFSSVGLGAPANTIYFNRVIQILFDASPLIFDVESVVLNGSSSAPFTSTNLQVPTIVPSTIVMTYVNP